MSSVQVARRVALLCGESGAEHILLNVAWAEVHVTMFVYFFAWGVVELVVLLDKSSLFVLKASYLVLLHMISSTTTLL